MKRQLLFVISLFLSLSIQAQELTIKEMQATNDLSASQYRRLDRNNKPCGLVKVRLATMGAQFEGNVIPPVEYKTGEYWVYMSEGSRELHIKHPSFLPVEVHFSNYGLPMGIQPLVTYTLTLSMPQTGSMDIDDGMRYLVMTVDPKDAIVYIDNQSQKMQNGTLSKLLLMGEHQYRVEAPDYETKTGTFVIGNETLKQSVTLESAMASLNISATTQGTQIYLNDQLRGTTSWSGSLSPGTYRVEGRLQGYHSYRQNVTLSKCDNQQVHIPALQAITGSLNVNYQPVDAEIWIDGKLIGKSPNVFRNVAIGNHEVELRASGYPPKKERITIEEGRTVTLTGSLNLQTVAQTAVDKTPSAEPGITHETITVNGVSFKMVLVEGGTFMMGATVEQGNDAFTDEKPVHQVTLSSYYIGETEVTVDLWNAIMDKKINRKNHFPVDCVNWYDCQEFISKLNKLSGKNFRLPTEAEWEYAARGGNKSKGYKYSGGNKMSEVGWYKGNRKPGPNFGAHEVKMKKANELGIYDMCGNVNEWCQDWYGDYTDEPKTNPTGPLNGQYKVLRGSGWSCHGGKYSPRLSKRICGDPKSHETSFNAIDIGFRLAL